MTSPPARLSAAARGVWAELADNLERSGILDWADRSALAEYCELAAQRDAIRRQVDLEGGVIVANQRGPSRVHPLMREYHRLFLRCSRLEDRLGMNPLARARLRNERNKLPRLRAARS